MVVIEDVEEDSELEEKIRRLKESANGLFKQGKYQPALQGYQAAIAFVTEDMSATISAPLHNNAAACFFHLKDFPQALQSASAAIALDDCYAKALFRRGLCYLEMERLNEAVLDFERARTKGYDGAGIQKAIQSVVTRRASMKGAAPEKKAKPVKATPSIDRHPASRVVDVGHGQCEFTVVATEGVNHKGYQWKKDGKKLKDGKGNSGANSSDGASEIQGSTTAKLAIENVQLADAGKYTCDVSNTAGTSVSAPGKLTVIVPFTFAQCAADTLAFFRQLPRDAWKEIVRLSGVAYQELKNACSYLLYRVLPLVLMCFAWLGIVAGYFYLQPTIVRAGLAVDSSVGTAKAATMSAAESAFSPFATLPIGILRANVLAVRESTLDVSVLGEGGAGGLNTGETYPSSGGDTLTLITAALADSSTNELHLYSWYKSSRPGGDGGGDDFHLVRNWSLTMPTLPSHSASTNSSALLFYELPPGSAGSRWKPTTTLEAITAGPAAWSSLMPPIPGMGSGASPVTDAGSADRVCDADEDGDEFVSGTASITNLLTGQDLDWVLVATDSWGGLHMFRPPAAEGANNAKQCRGASDGSTRVIVTPFAVVDTLSLAPNTEDGMSTSASPGARVVEVAMSYDANQQVHLIAAGLYGPPATVVLLTWDGEGGSTIIADGADINSDITILRRVRKVESIKVPSSLESIQVQAGVTASEEGHGGQATSEGRMQSMQVVGGRRFEGMGGGGGWASRSTGGDGMQLLVLLESRELHLLQLHHPQPAKRTTRAGGGKPRRHSRSHKAPCTLWQRSSGDEGGSGSRGAVTDAKTAHVLGGGERSGDISRNVFSADAAVALERSMWFGDIVHFVSVGSADLTFESYRWRHYWTNTTNNVLDQGTAATNSTAQKKQKHACEVKTIATDRGSAVGTGSSTIMTLSLRGYVITIVAEPSTTRAFAQNVTLRDQNAAGGAGAAAITSMLDIGGSLSTLAPSAPLAASVVISSSHTAKGNDLIFLTRSGEGGGTLTLLESHLPFEQNLFEADKLFLFGVVGVVLIVGAWNLWIFIKSERKRKEKRAATEHEHKEIIEAIEGITDNADRNLLGKTLQQLDEGARVKMLGQLKSLSAEERIAFVTKFKGRINTTSKAGSETASEKDGGGNGSKGTKGTNEGCEAEG
jgi:hypothetical protein